MDARCGSSYPSGPAEATGARKRGGPRRCPNERINGTRRSDRRALPHAGPRLPGARPRRSAGTRPGHRRVRADPRAHRGRRPHRPRVLRAMRSPRPPASSARRSIPRTDRGSTIRIRPRGTASRTARPRRSRRPRTAHRGGRRPPQANRSWSHHPGSHRHRCPQAPSDHDEHVGMASTTWASGICGRSSACCTCPRLGVSTYPGEPQCRSSSRSSPRFAGHEGRPAPRC